MPAGGDQLPSRGVPREARPTSRRQFIASELAPSSRRRRRRRSVTRSPAGRGSADAPATTDYHPAISGWPAYIPEERRRRRWIRTPSRSSNVARRLDKDDDSHHGSTALATRDFDREFIASGRRAAGDGGRRRPVIDGVGHMRGARTDVIKSSMTSFRVSLFQPCNRIESSVL